MQLREIFNLIVVWYRKRINPYEEFVPTEWGKKIANLGERLVPGIAGWPETIRHKSSYYFFKKIIEQDLKRHPKNRLVKIVDLGCGVGHGTKILSEIKNTEVVGIDNCPETIKYANHHFSGKNIKYMTEDLVKYVPKMPEFDYVVSRGVFEHIPNGLKLIFKSKWRSRLIFDVPYNEPPDNNHFHLETRITEKDFSNIKGAEFFLEDLNGNTFFLTAKPKHANLITCVLSNKNLEKIETVIRFPVKGWRGQKPRWMP